MRRLGLLAAAAALLVGAPLAAGAQTGRDPRLDAAPEVVQGQGASQPDNARPLIRYGGSHGQFHWVSLTTAGREGDLVRYWSFTVLVEPRPEAGARVVGRWVRHELDCRQRTVRFGEAMVLSDQYAVVSRGRDGRGPDPIYDGSEMDHMVRRFCRGEAMDDLPVANNVDDAVRLTQALGTV